MLLTLLAKRIDFSRHEMRFCLFLRIMKNRGSMECLKKTITILKEFLFSQLREANGFRNQASLLGEISSVDTRETALMNTSNVSWFVVCIYIRNNS